LLKSFEIKHFVSFLDLKIFKFLKKKETKDSDLRKEFFMGNKVFNFYKPLTMGGVKSLLDFLKFFV
jgi:hypothetical protein